MDEIKTRILEFFSKYPSQLFKTREVARRLRITEETAYRKLREALRELNEEKRIRRLKGKRYGFQPEQNMQQNGVLYMMRQGYGFVELESGEEVFIAPKNLGTALDGDHVRVVLFARPARKQQRQGIVLEGEIIKVIKRAHREIVGVLKKTKNFYFVEPDDSQIRRDVYIPKAFLKGARDSDKVIAVIEEWDDPQLNPEGRIKEVLGKSGNLNVELRSIAVQFDLPTKFPADVIEETDRFPDILPDEEYKRRLDLKSLPIITIDPEDAKDFDDALSLEYSDDGHFRLGVHIADVSYYVKENSALDKEAFKRGTSVYLVNGVIPMLPERLSNNLCSLRPGEDRPAYSVFMTISPRGIIKGYDIQETVIRSSRRYTYEEVQDIIDQKSGEYNDLILGLHKVSKVLLNKRVREGSIDFETAEVKFKLDKNGNPLEIIKKVRLDAHRLVEECMLAANKTVARHVGVGFDGSVRGKTSRRSENVNPFLYRIHEAPAVDKLKELTLFVSNFGYSLNINGKGLSKSIQKLLTDVHGSDEENIINEVTLRSMMKAVYSDKNIGHFGLGFQYYTHFTSPIRRYPDLIVHRMLKEYLTDISNDRKQFYREKVAYVGEHSSAMEQRAVDAERTSVKVMQVEYMQRHLGEEFEGIISGVVNYGIFVELIDSLVEGMVHVRNMEGDYYTFDAGSYTMVGQRTGKRYRLGDRVRVKVISINPERTEIDFMLVD